MCFLVGDAAHAMHPLTGQEDTSLIFDKGTRDIYVEEKKHRAASKALFGHREISDGILRLK